jgi:hypothetical protein
LNPNPVCALGLEIPRLKKGKLLNDAFEDTEIFDRWFFFSKIALSHLINSYKILNSNGSQMSSKLCLGCSTWWPHSDDKNKGKRLS